jgi:hypothetical protein
VAGRGKARLAWRSERGTGEQRVGRGDGSRDGEREPQDAYGKSSSAVQRLAQKEMRAPPGKVKRV